ncbi:MAG: L-fucose/L-arabinose isomerase family protein [Armatimonadota bacterium]
MAHRRPLLGLCPVGKFVFSNEDAVRHKQLLQSRLKQWGIPFADLEGVLEDGLVKDQAHVAAAVAHLRKAGADCLFLPHCNFGTEGAVGMIAKKLGLPTLLWGPRDEAPLPDGRRLRDTLCGLLASSKILHKLGVPFTYIENCRVDDGLLQAGLDTFLRAVAAAKVLRDGVRIGLIGQRIDFFWTTIINESELLERFHVEVLPLDMVQFVEDAIQRAQADREAYAAEVRELRKSYQVEGFDSDLPLMNVLAVRDQMLALAETHGLDGIAFQSFMSVIEATGAYCSYAESLVSERLPVGAESDIHGVISDLLLRRAGFATEATFLTEFTVRHPADDNGVLLWHAGAPISLCHPEDTPRIGHHWILPSPLSGMLHFRLKDGPITVARFDGDRSEYQLAVGEGHSMDGPTTLNNYVWMKVDDWPAWERTLMEGPFIHHVAMGYGRYRDALVEACKYVPGLTPVRLGRS